MSAKTRVATVGVGYFSQFHYNAWGRLAAEGRAELVAVCDLDAERAASVAVEHGAQVFSEFRQMLAEAQPDLVDIITPPPTHEELVRIALEHDVAIICQKPFTPSLADAERLTQHIGQSGGLVVVHENFRFQPWYAQIKSLLQEGLPGELYQVSFRLRPGDGQGAGAYLDRQAYFQQMPRFLVHETAVHQIDVFRYLAGEVRSVYAQLDRLNPAIAGEDAGLIIFELEHGVRGVFDGNRLVDHAAQNRRLTMGEMCLEGAAGTLRLNGDAEIYFRAHGENDEQRIDYSWNNENFGGDCVYRLQAHVLDHLHSGDPLMNTAADYMENLQIVDAVYRSAESGSKCLLHR